MHPNFTMLTIDAFEEKQKVIPQFKITTLRKHSKKVIFEIHAEKLGINMVIKMCE